MVQLTAMFAALYLDDLPVAILGTLFLLLGAGGSTAILTFARVREQNEPFAHGAAMGIVNTAIMSSAVVLQPTLGVLLDLQWDGAMAEGARVYTGAAYRSAFLVMPAACLLGLLSAWLGKDRRQAHVVRRP